MALFGKKYKEENELLRAKVAELSALMTPEMSDLANIKNEIARQEIIKTQIESAIAGMEYTYKSLAQKVQNLEAQVIVAEETIELESFSLYQPRWDFVKADEYKNALKSIIDMQKAMIKNNTAAYGNMEWTVNNNRAKGQKLVRDMMKLCLRSFNNECDAAISSVKFNNYDRCEARIYKSADAVEKLGKIMNVGISRNYINLKIQELQLALEYQIKKQEEKDHLRELKAQEREEAKALKEMEAARKVAQKEQSHYTNALNQVIEQLNGNLDPSAQQELLTKKADIENRLNVINQNIADLDYKFSNHKAGYVYIISNIGAFGENIYKIGMTRRLEPQERIDELGDASVPFKFDVHALIFSDDAPALEAALHKEFDDKKVNMVNSRKEFFSVTLDEIKKVVHDNHDKVVEFIDVAPAEQYRESLKMKR